MTLVIAEKFSNRAIILSDTLISYGPKDSPVHKYDKERSTIKTIIVSKNICISFAGKNYYAEKALYDISQSPKTSQDILSILDYYNKRSQGKTDFVAFFGSPKSELYIVKEAQGPIEVEKCYIGLQPAYKEYLSIYNDENKINVYSNESILELNKLPDTFSQDENENYNKMRNAFIGVINSNIKGVGGFVTSLIYENDEMKYLPQFTTNIKISDFDNLPKMDLQTVTFHIEKKEDIDHIENFVCDDNFIAIHFPLVNIGIIYDRESMGLLYPEIMPEFDEIDFFDFLEKEKGYDRKLSVLVNHREQHFTIKGNYFLSKKEHLKAIQFYFRAIDRLFYHNSRNDNILIIRHYQDLMHELETINIDFIDLHVFNEVLSYLDNKTIKFIEQLNNIQNEKSKSYLKESFKIILYQRGLAYYDYTTSKLKKEIEQNDNRFLIKAYVDFSIVSKIEKSYEKVEVLRVSTFALLSLC